MTQKEYKIYCYFCVYFPKIIHIPIRLFYFLFCLHLSFQSEFQPVPDPRHLLWLLYYGAHFMHRKVKKLNLGETNFLCDKAVVFSDRKSSNPLFNAISGGSLWTVWIEMKNHNDDIYNIRHIRFAWSIYLSLRNNSDLYKLLLTAIYISVKMPADIWSILFASTKCLFNCICH